MTGSDDFVYDEELLIEAARFAVARGVQFTQFMAQSKKCWLQAEAEQRGAAKEASHWSRPKKTPGRAS